MKCCGWCVDADKVTQVHWSTTDDRSVDEWNYLETDTFPDLLPMEFFQHRRDVGIFWHTHDQSSSCILKMLYLDSSCQLCQITENYNSLVFMSLVH